MKISGIRAVNFRNYTGCELNFTAMVNVFFGNNAQGKTNILESIFFSSSGSSHRTSDEEELVHIDCREMLVEVTYENYSGDHELKLKKFAVNGKWKKEICLDGSKITPKEHYGSLNAVMFSPEDLQLIKGDASVRRRFFNMQIAQTDPVYYDMLLKYNRILLHRNRLLKDIREKKASAEMLFAWDERFAELASQITLKRTAALTKLQIIAENNYTAVSGAPEKLSVHYKFKAYGNEIFFPAADINFDDLREFYIGSLRKNTAADIARGFTGIGPHRDDLEILCDGRSFKSFGSQGQQRTCALALKLSQLEYVFKETGEYPVLLLDDVMSELDSRRREHLLKFIDGKVQTFITVNDKSLVPELAGNAYFHITNGLITEVEHV